MADATALTDEVRRVLLWAEESKQAPFARAVYVVDAQELGLVRPAGPGRWELTDDGRAALDEYAPQIAGWAYAGQKPDGTNRSSRRAHWFAGRSGAVLTSACGDWVKPTYRRTPLRPEPDPDPRGDCGTCQRKAATR